MAYSRPDGRAADALRKVEIHTDYTKWAEGSALVCFGDTKVLCNATVDERVPGWMKDQGRGWITAEYSMLPRATDRRTQRESIQGKVGGRTHEISRLIGRCLRAGVQLNALGERTITLDCDVIQADGGTRTAAITGAFVALSIAVKRLKRRNAFKKDPIKNYVAAVSLGVIGKLVLLDLAYKEDQVADTDLNLVMTDQGSLIEIQGTAEGTPFSKEHLAQMLVLGQEGIESLIEAQQHALELWEANSVRR